MDEKMDMRKLTREAETNLTGKRFCSSCQQMKPSSYGKVVEGKLIKRWQCGTCVERKSVPAYRSKKGEGDA